MSAEIMLPLMLVVPGLLLQAAVRNPSPEPVLQVEKPAPSPSACFAVDYVESGRAFTTEDPLHRKRTHDYNYFAEYLRDRLALALESKGLRQIATPQTAHCHQVLVDLLRIAGVGGADRLGDTISGIDVTASVRVVNPAGESLYAKNYRGEAAGGFRTGLLYKSVDPQLDRSIDDMIGYVVVDERFLQTLRSQTEGAAQRPQPGPQDSGSTGGNASGQPYKLQVRKMVEPRYTNEGKRQGIEGTVVLYVSITAEGRASDIVVLKPLGHGLDEEAVRAVRRWEFSPLIKNSVPVSTHREIKVNFRLDRK